MTTAAEREQAKREKAERERLAQEEAEAAAEQEREQAASQNRITIIEPEPPAGEEDLAHDIATSTGAAAGAESIADREERIQALIDSGVLEEGDRIALQSTLSELRRRAAAQPGDPATATHFTIAHQGVDHWTEGEVLPRATFTEAQITRLTKLGAIRASSKDELRTAGLAE